MLGAIIGDIVGSRFEWHNHKSKEFELFTPKCRPTDDSNMTLAVALALLRAKARTVEGEADAKLRLIRFALQRGYNYDQVKIAIEKI